jgi:hypothetical protein
MENVVELVLGKKRLHNGGVDHRSLHKLRPIGHVSKKPTRQVIESNHAMALLQE